MPIRQFLLFKQGKELGHAYRARSVEAIRLCRNLEQGLVTQHGTMDRGAYILQPGTIQNADYLRSEDIRERILNAVWEAVQLACSPEGRNRAADDAFESLSSLLRSYNNEKFALSIEGLERAKQRDERTAKLFSDFSDKYKGAKPIKKKKKHLFTVYCGKQKASIELLVDYPPEVHALAWRLKKRCSTATRILPLRNPHFYPWPFIENLNEQLVGRPLGFWGGQTYGLTPRAGKWTPQIEVYGDDPNGPYFKLESAWFFSAFRSIINIENSSRVVFRDGFGQLITKNAIEKLVENTEEIKYRSCEMLQAIIRTLGQIADIPFLHTQGNPARSAIAPRPQGQGHEEAHPTPGQQKERRPEPPALDLPSSGPSLLESIESALQIERPTTPGSGVVNTLLLLLAPNPREDVSLQATIQPGPHRDIGETSMGGSNRRASTSSPRVSLNAILKIQDPAGIVLSPTDNETRNISLSPEGLPHQSPQSDGRLTLPPMVIEGWDSGYWSDGPTRLPSLSEARICTTSIPAALPAARDTEDVSQTKAQNGNTSCPAPSDPPVLTPVPKGSIEGTKDSPNPPQITADSTRMPGVHSDSSVSAPKSSLRIGADSRMPTPDAVPSFTEPPEESPQVQPIPPPILTGHASIEPTRTLQDDQTGNATIFPPQRFAWLKTKGAGPTEKGIAACITIASSNAASLLPYTSEAFPGARLARLEKKKKGSWVQKHIVEPVKSAVRKTFK